eukprot:m.39943 g.39943  ORF g.39943 m.39943 type:complete len:956 (+) comp5586_c0_seq2:3-2870(+)
MAAEVAAHLPSWFHGRLSRGEADELLDKYGCADGLFLVRESARDNGFVLSMCHQKEKGHFQISCEQLNEETLLRIDTDSNTGPQFTCLDGVFHYLLNNPAVLPCPLTQWVSRVQRSDPSGTSKFQRTVSISGTLAGTISDALAQAGRPKHSDLYSTVMGDPAALDLVPNVQLREDAPALARDAIMGVAVPLKAGDVLEFIALARDADNNELVIVRNKMGFILSLPLYCPLQVIRVNSLETVMTATQPLINLDNLMDMLPKLELPTVMGDLSFTPTGTMSTDLSSSASTLLEFPADSLLPSILYPMGPPPVPPSLSTQPRAQPPVPTAPPTVPPSLASGAPTVPPSIPSSAPPPVAPRGALPAPPSQPDSAASTPANTLVPSPSVVVSGSLADIPLPSMPPSNRTSVASSAAPSVIVTPGSRTGSISALRSGAPAQAAKQAAAKTATPSMVHQESLSSLLDSSGGLQLHERLLTSSSMFYRDVIKEGWLCKLPPARNKFQAWRRRWFKLVIQLHQQSLAHGPVLLEYYTSPSAAKPRGIIDLDTVTRIAGLVSCNHDRRLRNLNPGRLFEIETQFRTYTIMADGPSAVGDWVQGLAEIMGMSGPKPATLAVKPAEGPREYSGVLLNSEVSNALAILAVTERCIRLICPDSRRELETWPLHLIKGFGYIKQVLWFEAVTKPDSPPGVLCFSSPEAAAIYDVLAAAIERAVQGSSRRQRASRRHNIGWSSLETPGGTRRMSTTDADDDFLAPAAPPRAYKEMAPRQIFGRSIPVEELLPVALGVAIVAHGGVGPNEFSYNEREKLKILATRAFLDQGYFLAEKIQKQGYGLVSENNLELLDLDFGEDGLQRAESRDSLLDGVDPELFKLLDFGSGGVPGSAKRKYASLVLKSGTADTLQNIIASDSVVYESPVSAKMREPVYQNTGRAVPLRFEELDGEPTPRGTSAHVYAQPEKPKK